MISINHQNFVEDPSNYIQKQIKHFQVTKELVQQNEQNYFQNNQKFLKGVNLNFELDDIVYLKSLTSTTMFKRKNLGPYIITRKIRNDNYLIRELNDETAKVIKVHVSKLCKKS